MKRHPALVALSHYHHHALVEARRLRRAAAADNEPAAAAVGRRAIVCAIVRNACKGRFPQNLRYKPPCTTTTLILVNRRICRGFLKRSGAGVEPTQPWATR